MIKRKYVPLRIAQPGMMIDQAIIDRAGRVLIARRTRLEDFHIDALKKMGVTGIYTCEGTEDVKPAEADQTQQLPEPLQKKYDQVKVKDPAKVQISESVRSRVAQGVQYLYQDTQSADFTNASRSITDDLLKAIEDNDAVAVDIGALKVSDEYTFKHSVDVATMSMIVARKYGLDDQQVYEIGIAGLLHDIGKSKIPNEILNKAARLTDEEFAIMKQHSVYGYRILQPKEDLSTEIKLGVLQHHEKINGKGYPMGVTGDKIDLFARLISISDIYDALVTERPYKKPFSPRDAVEMIMSMTEELDINVMRCFLESVILYPVGTDVALSNGETARVVENIPNAVLRPKVLGLTTTVSHRFKNILTVITDKVIGILCAKIRINILNLYRCRTVSYFYIPAGGILCIDITKAEIRIGHTTHLRNIIFTIRILIKMQKFSICNRFKGIGLPYFFRP